MRTRSLQGTALTLAAVCIGLVMAALVPGATAEQAGSSARGLQAGMLDAGGNHSCAVRRDGSAACWGIPADGRLGDGDTGVTNPTPVPVEVQRPGGRSLHALSAGEAHTCALLDDGLVACWGRDSSGQLGDGVPGAPAPDPTPNIIALPGNHTATAITTGRFHTCAILENGMVACWGDDENGQLGDGATDPLGDPHPTPQLVGMPDGLSAVAISAGRFHTCVILSDGSVACWGSNVGSVAGAELGRGVVVADPAQAAAQRTVALGQKAVAIAGGDDHTCALLESGTVSCWGSNGAGALGTGSAGGPAVNAPLPGISPTGRTAVAIATGGNHTCAVLDNRSLACWGANGFGQLGQAFTSTNNAVPTKVDLPAAHAVVAVGGGGTHTCATLDDASVLCWGADAFGQLGDGAVGTPDPQPDPLAQSRALPAGTMLLRADLSMSISGAPASLTVGQTAQATVRVANAGPDPASGVTVGLSATGVAASSATLAMGTIAPGTEATQVVTLTGSTVGAATLTAEVTASGAKDLDSTPNNGVATEDDRAQVAITVAAPAATPPPVTPTVLTLTKPSLSRKTFRAQGLRGTRKVGTTITFTLSTDAAVTVTIERKVGTKFKKAGTIRFNAKKGVVRRAFSGRLAGKPLAIGKYRLRIQAKAGTTTVRSVLLPFTVAIR
jgi:alpha-tubulin suppressor-like RCC1 family protein